MKSQSVPVLVGFGGMHRMITDVLASTVSEAELTGWAVGGRKEGDGRGTRQRGIEIGEVCVAIIQTEYRGNKQWATQLDFVSPFSFYGFAVFLFSVVSESPFVFRYA